MKFITSRMFLGTVGAILATGTLLNVANQGTFGATVQKFSKFVTTGYGAGAL